MNPYKTILYVLLPLFFSACSNEINDELSLEKTLEGLIIGEWVITDFSSENTVLTSKSFGKKIAVTINNSNENGTDDLVLDFKSNPKQLITDGDFSITMTGKSESFTFLKTYNCSDFLDNLLIGEWGIINSNLYLSHEKIPVSILIQDLTSTQLKLNVTIDQTIDANGKEATLNALFCLTFSRIN
ncbi:MAG: hypothetical protein JKY08_00510 [Flavobacteriaceae bacterium]|nr:hypothetical protein [Flavobacteriaceae bacterium]